MQMMSRMLTYEGFSISVAEGWDDITSTLEDPDAPLTVANPDSGVGALQFTPALYKSGAVPQVGSEELGELLDDFASKQGLGEPFDRLSYSGEIAIEGASFHSDDDLIRVWYVSDTQSVMLATYVCDWKEREREAAEREMTVRSIRFRM
jgi:hypothetical protein